MNTTASSVSARLSDRLSAHLAPVATDARPATPASDVETRHYYDPASTLRQARTRYFEDNAFGADGGYSARWVEVKVGPFPYAIPNTEGRVRALRYHDLHHIMTGYRTDWTGETEISAWEPRQRLSRLPRRLVPQHQRPGPRRRARAPAPVPGVRPRPALAQPL